MVILSQQNGAHNLGRAHDACVKLHIFYWLLANACGGKIRMLIRYVKEKCYHDVG